jgi:16S rRNA (guanine966-N2)-methyltransferase
MRIIAGMAKGMPLAVPRSGVRPTADRIREAIFSSLGERVIGATVLDLFAGTGALGLEAASRGAASVAFVEQSRSALTSLEKNVETFRKNRDVSCALRIIRADAFNQLRKLAGGRHNFSLVFADPPYGETAQALLASEHLPPLVATGGLFVLESARRDQLNVPPLWKLIRESVYGDTRASFLARSETVGERRV